MDKIGRNFGFTAEEFCKGAVNFARMTAGGNGGGNTAVEITGHESDAKDVSDSFVDFSIHFSIKTDIDNVLQVQ